MNKKYGRDAKDLGEYSKKEYTDYHYNTYGKKEGRLDNEGYKRNINRINRTEQNNKAAPEEIIKKMPKLIWIHSKDY